MGDRLQVPAGGGDHPAPGHPGQRRPHRSGDAVRGAGAGADRRFDSGAGHPAQPARGGPQGREDRRHRGGPQGRRRHPGDPRSGGRPAGGSRVARLRHAHPLPGVRDGTAPGEGGRRRHPLPELPSAAPPNCGSGCSTWPGGARSTSRGWATRRRSRCWQRGADQDEGDIFVLDEERLSARPVLHHEGRGAVRERRASCCPTCRPARTPAAVAGAGRPVHPARRADRRPGAGPAVRVDGPRSGRAPRRSSPPPTGSARPSPTRCTSGSPSTGTAKIVDKWAAAGVRMADEARATPRPDPRPGVTVVVTGSLRDLHPRRGEGRHPGAGRQGRPARCRRRPAFVVVGDDPGSKYDKARVRWRRRSWTRPGSGCCSSRGRTRRERSRPTRRSRRRNEPRRAGLRTVVARIPGRPVPGLRADARGRADPVARAAAGVPADAVRAGARRAAGPPARPRLRPPVHRRRVRPTRPRPAVGPVGRFRTLVAAEPGTTRSHPAAAAGQRGVHPAGGRRAAPRHRGLQRPDPGRGVRRRGGPGRVRPDRRLRAAVLGRGHLHPARRARGRRPAAAGLVARHREDVRDQHRRRAAGRRRPGGGRVHRLRARADRRPALGSAGRPDLPAHRHSRPGRPALAGRDRRAR